MISGVIAVFFLYTKPAYQRALLTRDEVAQVRQTLDQARNITAVRDTLLSKYNSIPEEEMARLTKMLPDHVDNVRLILEIESIATRYGMVMRDLAILRTDDSRQNGPPEFRRDGSRAEEDSLGTNSLSFSVLSSYGTFLQFLRDLETSLRVVDITSLEFARDETGKAADFYKFKVSVQTYWLTPTS